VPAGNVPAVSPAVAAELTQALRDPEGFASYGAIQTWLMATHGIHMA
jgi:hypothetical protein